MIPKECKRLIEVDFPIKVVGDNSLAEKAKRIGTPHQIHLWWAWRPLNACRAVLLGTLFPDPCDNHCPEYFKELARKALNALPIVVHDNDLGLRHALLDFIAMFSHWDRSNEPIWLEASKKLIEAMNEKEVPFVVDPFAGSGSIPFEAIRIGCESFSSDLNPVSVMIQKLLLNDLPRLGDNIENHIKGFEDVFNNKIEKLFSNLYPKETDGSTVLAYLWARSVNCESPECGVEIPLIKSLWLSKKEIILKAGERKKRVIRGKQALKYNIFMNNNKSEIQFEIITPKDISEVQTGTVDRGNALCPSCRTVLQNSRVRSQLKMQNGGADPIFDDNGNRVGGARLLAVVTINKSFKGRRYRIAKQDDYKPFLLAANKVKELSPGSIPNEPIPEMSGTFNAPLYGAKTWGDLFNSRQKYVLYSICKEIEKLSNESNEQQMVKTIASLTLSKLSERSNSLSEWMLDVECPGHLFTQQSIPQKWDYSESNIISGSSGSFQKSLQTTKTNIRSSVLRNVIPTMPNIADAQHSPLPDKSCSVWFTDPPYYFAVPYADLSDFFFVWLKRCLPNSELLKDPFDLNNPLTPKNEEICEMSKWDKDRYAHKDKDFFENGMYLSFKEGRRILKDDGIGCVVFAHKTTEGWEALLSGMLKAGWTITGSWPITTERASRSRARDSAALASSIHLVCRPRPDDAAIGEWEDILRELPKKMKKWVIRLDNEGIHGADLVFSCIGPALELFSKYRKVETAEGEEVKLAPKDVANSEAAKRGYLSYIWEVVGRTALELVLSGDSEEGIGSLEEDARLCALFLWTQQSTETQNGEKKNGDKSKISGISLPFDIVRRFAQPLGIHLPDWEDRIISTEKGVVKLIPVVKRAKQLFGEDITAATSQFELQAKEDPQIELSLALETGTAPEIGGRRRGGTITSEEFERASTATTLDRVHAAMLLQAGGKTNALRALLKQEVERGPEFLRLANSLSALYPKGVEEKRLLDAMLLAVPR